MQKTVLVAFVLARIWKRMATILVRLVMLKAACVRIATTQCSDLRTIPWLIPKAAHVCIAPRRAASPSKPPTSSDLETASSHPYTHHPTLPPFKGGDLGSRPDHIHHYNSSYAETRVPGSFAHADAGPDTRGGELERYEEIDVADLWDVNLE